MRAIEQHWRIVSSASIKGARSACVPPCWQFASKRDIALQCSGSAAKVGIVSSSAAVSSPTRSSGVSWLAHGISKSISCRWASVDARKASAQTVISASAASPHSSDQAPAQVTIASDIFVRSDRRLATSAGFDGAFWRQAAKTSMASSSLACTALGARCSPVCVCAAPRTSAMVSFEPRYPILIADRTGGDLAAGIAQRNKMAGKIAAIHRGDIFRLQRAQVARIVPIVKMALESAPASPSSRMFPRVAPRRQAFPASRNRVRR